MKYTAADLPNLLDRINRHSIGMDEYFDRLFNVHETTSNYPPFNLVSLTSTESRLEIALAGFKPKEVNVYTQDGKLFVEGRKRTKQEKQHSSIEEWKPTIFHQRNWTLAEDTEVESVEFENGQP